MESGAAARVRARRVEGAVLDMTVAVLRVNNRLYFQLDFVSEKTIGLKSQSRVHCCVDLKAHCPLVYNVIIVMLA